MGMDEREVSEMAAIFQHLPLNTFHLPLNLKACSNEANIVQHCWANNVAQRWTKIQV